MSPLSFYDFLAFFINYSIKNTIFAFYYKTYKNMIDIKQLKIGDTVLLKNYNMEMEIFGINAIDNTVLVDFIPNVFDWLPIVLFNLYIA